MPNGSLLLVDEKEKVTHLNMMQTPLLNLDAEMRGWFDARAS
jgi:hypothetical protein